MPAYGRFLGTGSTSTTRVIGDHEITGKNVRVQGMVLEGSLLLKGNNTKLTDVRVVSSRNSVMVPGNAEEVRQAVGAFVERHNAEWRVEKNGYASPSTARANWTAANSVEAA